MADTTSHVPSPGFLKRNEGSQSSTMLIIFDTAKNEGILKGASKREIEIAKEIKKYGDLIEKASAITGLSKEQIEKL